MTFRIPFIDLYGGAAEAIADSICEEIRRLVATSEFILGKQVQEFELKYAALAGCRFGVGVNSGLDALILALRALNIGEGDEVVTVPNSFIASAAAIALVGARPVFADVGEDYNLDVKCMEAAITRLTKAIIPVHLTGNPCQMDLIGSIARERGIAVIEDAAQAVGATYLGRPVGGWGDLGCFSLHPLKNLHVWGDGGMITVNSESLRDSLRLQRNHGLLNRDESEFFSYNSRLDTLQAIVGNAFLSRLGETTRKRQLLANIYRERLACLGDVLHLPLVDETRAQHVYHVFQVWSRERDDLRKFLAERGIETKIHYPIPLHLQKACQRLGYKRGDFPVTERLAEGILSLPIRENLSPEEIHLICDEVTAFFHSRRKLSREINRQPFAESHSSN